MLTGAGCSGEGETGLRSARQGGVFFFLGLIQWRVYSCCSEKNAFGKARWRGDFEEQMET